MAEILKKHHPFSWLYFFRRIAPAAPTGESAITVFLRRTALDLAAYKYGNPDIQGEIRPGKDCEPDDVLQGDWVRVCREIGMPASLKPEILYACDIGFREYKESHILEFLADEIWHCGCMLRRIQKGGTLVVDQQRGPHVVLPHDLEECVSIYDSNCEEYGSATASSGTPIRTLMDASGDELLVTPRYNVERLEFGNIPIRYGDKTFTMLPTKYNFIPIPASFPDIHALVPLAGSSFEKSTGIDLEKLLLILLCLGQWPFLAMAYGNGRRLRSYLQRAYLMDSIDGLSDSLFTMANAKAGVLGTTNFMNKDEVRAILDFLTWTNESSAQINLVTMGPVKLLLKVSEERVIVDHSLFMPFITTVIHFIEGDESAKGSAFEELARARVQKIN